MKEKIFYKECFTTLDESNAICFSDTEEIREAIKNDRPIPVSREQFELIDALTKLMLSN